ncbi:hypothetical protein MEG1DRAFT_01785 [Photorhabdus temperata subsp. temperata Meg1]|uniref:Uncharacterized protein n=1 Tax=Photorhabdus temperata subsp. temperata Meg1 TaxID=1393735 RepID=A0A081RXW3_PHOTE|nr:hypothetical protein MEG1DRAFT_01785 [Photorhabdus temperata subsp. temperata Meg1]
MKNYTISPQIINIMEISNEQRGVKDSSSCFIYHNSVTKRFIHNVLSIGSHKFKPLAINCTIGFNHE